MTNRNAVAAVLQDPKYAEYQRGVTDCAMLVADCCLALSGKDPAAEYRDQYDDLKGALSILQKHGSIADALDRHFERVDVAFMQRGDAVQMGDPTSVGIWWAGKIWTCEESTGLIAVDREISAAWRSE
ncbi:MAG: DUF6950 family protein [Plesiomonas shigelloides]